MLFGFVQRSALRERRAEMPVSPRRFRIERKCATEFADRGIELTARCESDPQLVVNIGRFWNNRAEVLAAGDDASDLGELSRAHTFSRSRGICFAQEPEIEIKSRYYGNGHT